MKLQTSLLLGLVAVSHAQGSSSSAPPPSPSGLPYPDTTYPEAVSKDPQVIAGTKANQTSPPKYPSPWGTGYGDWASAYAKAQAFVKQLTLLEKVNLTTGVGWQGEQCVGATGSVPRLNFRALCMQDGPTGIRFADFVTVFPAGVNVAASWSRALAKQRGQAMGEEHRNKGVDVQLGPVAGPLGRSPEGGRNWEGFSSDPYLTGVMMKETIEGMQSEGVIACAKHFIGNEQEHFRQPGQQFFNNKYASSSNIDDKTMHEIYMWPFADAVRANVGSVMCSYQQVNNSYACQNSYLNNYLLKGELGFQGFIMSDWGAQHGGVASTFSGLDMTMPGDVAFNSDTSYWGPNMTAAVLNGTVPQWRLDDQVVRIMAAYYFVGRDAKRVPVNFDSWSPNTVDYIHYYAKDGLQQVNQHVDVRNGHQQFTRKLASYSTVLLKNKNHALPLSGYEKLTGVFGEDAGSNVWGENGCPDRGCDNGTLAMAWGSGTADFASLVTPQMAILTKLIGNGRAVESILDNWATTQIQRLAGRVDTAIVFVNADAGEGFIDVDGNVGDRLNLTLWRNGDTLVKNVSALCNNTIVVIHSTGPVILEDIAKNENVTAILWAGIPGDQSGYGISDVLYGHVNPGAKLPFTIGKKRRDYGSDLLYEPNGDPSQTQFQEGNNIDYHYFDAAKIEPTYEFGFGLSYTTFGYSNLQITPTNAGPYTPNTKGLPKAPTYGSIDKNVNHYLFPSNIHRVWNYIYPYLNSTDLKNATTDPDYGKDFKYPKGATDGGPQKGVPAGGAPGGNPQLFDVLYTVTATITNTGKVAGDEVPQVYVSLGGKYDPPRVLRGFDRITLQPGQSATFKADLTRRDVSNWDSATQNWVITKNAKTVYVGSSSRKLQLKASLPTSY